MKRKFLRKIGDTSDSVKVLRILGFKCTGDKPIEEYEPRSFNILPSDPEVDPVIIAAHDEKRFLWTLMVKGIAQDIDVAMIEDILLNHCGFTREQKKSELKAG